ncbi:unnamed protein product [Trypanosoma congolense IL3000]|uniref:WGS project CAEQ00000000 data, annotated contig 1158 n=1 Tax=Trypanosoma congolense (strain IL3000) TaxID=1068625 RepID=F9W486_TRYCI|nr:unnamed protein product [Trypanosoma congolense IL3000]
MCALPAELFRGDPEDFIALRQHAQRLASGDSTKPSARCMDCGSPKLPSSCFHGSPSGSRSLAQSPTQRDGERCNSSASRGADCSPLLRNGSQKDEKYLLHTDLSSAQQAFQSVAIRHGYWLSYSEHMLRRPPFHACGLPLRAARDIAVWQRPPDMGLLSNETVPHGSGEGRFTDFEGSFNATTLSKASKVSSVLDAEAHLFDGSIYSDAVSLLRKDLTRDKGGRPRMLAPLLVYAHGGYGTAPFSVCDAADSMPVGEQDVDNDDFQYDDRCQFSFGGNSEGNAEVDMRDVYLSMPDEFLHPEPSLLPLHYIMQSIYSSVRENRTIQIDKSTRAALPVVVDLLVDAVKSYEGFLQSFIDASFESSSLASFFFRTYQDIVLDWVPFVICETAIEYAIGRVAACPTGNTWVFAVRHGGFTEAELEEIAFSGLIQRTFPSLTHWTYDEELLRKTVDTVRDVVLSTIVRVKGELYFLFTGVDNRKLFFERYQEMLKREREELLAVQAKVEEEMNARIPGYSKSGRCTPFQQGKTKSMEFSVGSRRPASGLKRQSSVALKALGNISHAKRVATGETPGQQNGAVSGPLEQSQCGVTVCCPP